VERLSNGSTYAGLELNGTTPILLGLSGIVRAWATTRKTLHVYTSSISFLAPTHLPPCASIASFIQSIPSSQSLPRLSPSPFHPLQSYTPPSRHLPQAHQSHLTLPSPHSTHHARPVPERDAVAARVAMCDQGPTLDCGQGEARCRSGGGASRAEQSVRRRSCSLSSQWIFSPGDCRSKLST
jgi:hypothetical protein